MMLTPCLHTAVCQIKFNYIFMATVARALQLALCRPWNAPLTPQQQQQQHTAATVVLLVIQSVFVFVFFFILFYFQLFYCFRFPPLPSLHWLHLAHSSIWCNTLHCQSQIFPLFNQHGSTVMMDMQNVGKHKSHLFNCWYINLYTNVCMYVCVYLWAQYVPV